MLLEKRYLAENGPDPKIGALIWRSLGRYLARIIKHQTPTSKGLPYFESKEEAPMHQQ